MTELYFGRRFCGPPGMANGGFACGSIAALHGGAAQVTLRRPLPLERSLAARHDGHGALLVRDGDTLLAESQSAARPGDGLRIFPGPVAGRVLWAAPWTPDPSVASADRSIRPEVIWAALDCPSGLAAAEAAGLAQDTIILLGQMTVSLAGLPLAGDPCRVIAWPSERDGRKLIAGSALLGPGDEVLAAARAVWVTVPRPAPALTAEGASS